jgi:RNA polymerase sigma-70 factor (ECF subfamily)
MGAARTPLQPPSPEQAAFLERAMEQYGRAAYTYAYRLTGNQADANDLAQDAFLRVYRAWDSFTPGTSFIAWIYRILTNLHRDELRRRKGRYLEELPQDNSPQDFGALRSQTGTPADDYVERQLSEPLSRSLARLSLEQRQAVVLADIEEYSYQEIAEIMGCSIGTVRSRLHRARAVLKRLLDLEKQPQS